MSNIYLDGSSQEAFDASFDRLLTELAADAERAKTYTHFQCLRCKHVQPKEVYPCEACGYNTGYLFLPKEVA